MATDNIVRVVFEAVMSSFSNNIDIALEQTEKKIDQFSQKSSSLLEAGFAGISASITTKLLDLAQQAGSKIFDTLFGDPVKVYSVTKIFSIKPQGYF